jgi:hypothetical protein
MTTRRRIPLPDGAAKTGAAPITASPAIRRSGYVTSAARERAEAAIAEPGCVRDSVVSDIADPFSATVVRTCLRMPLGKRVDAVLLVPARDARWDGARADF